MKKLFSSLPDDVKQTVSSLAVAVALLCGSLFMLSSYIDSIRTDKENSSVAAIPTEESTAVPD